MSEEVWIPETPETRTYACPKCSKGVKCIRIGNSSSYWVMDAADENHNHDCKYDGPISPKLLGFVPNKGKKT